MRRLAFIAFAAAAAAACDSSSQLSGKGDAGGNDAGVRGDSGSNADGALAQEGDRDAAAGTDSAASDALGLTDGGYLGDTSGAAQSGKPVLLVDDDESDNNATPNNPNVPRSASDKLFAQELTSLGLAFDSYIVPSGANGPDLQTLKKYANVVWYTGDKYGNTPNTDTLSALDETRLKGYLDAGDKSLMVFSSGYFYGLPGDNSWDGFDAQNTFAIKYLGMAGGEDGTGNVDDPTVTGTSGSTAGLALAVPEDSVVSSNWNLVNPTAGTDVLFTVRYYLNDSESASALAVAIGRRGVGSLMSSKTVFVGFAVENIDDPPTKKKTLDALFAY